MGVTGLWALIEPVGRPIRAESLAGERLAIDSSIWLYHFRMAMRDKTGRALHNAHVLGFLWRILRLLHLGIKPVFVFDGGAPVLKRRTLASRRHRREGAKESHARTAERLLHAQLREAALRQAVDDQEKAKQAQKDKWEQVRAEGGDEDASPGLGPDVVYQDDLTANNPPPRAPSPPLPAQSLQPSTSKGKGKATDKLSASKKDYHKDPYALPPMETSLATIGLRPTSRRDGGLKRQDLSKEGPARKAKADFRYATEGELRDLMSSLRPSDLSVDSPVFASLPVSLQYELVGDMRAQSRGTSFKRLQSMITAAPTASDFSRQQVLGLKTRNEWTQRVLEVTDEIGRAHIKVNVDPRDEFTAQHGRIVGSRSKEYVLVRNEVDGGFILGRQRPNEGDTKSTAIDVDKPQRKSAADLLATDAEFRTSRSRPPESDEEEFEEVQDAGPVEANTSFSSTEDAEDARQRKAQAVSIIEQRARAHAKQARLDAGKPSIEDVIEDEDAQAAAVAEAEHSSGKPPKKRKKLFRHAQPEFELPSRMALASSNRPHPAPEPVTVDSETDSDMEVGRERPRQAPELDLGPIPATGLNESRDQDEARNDGMSDMSFEPVNMSEMDIPLDMYAAALPSSGQAALPTTSASQLKRKRSPSPVQLPHDEPIETPRHDAISSTPPKHYVAKSPTRSSSSPPPRHPPPSQHSKLPDSDTKPRSEQNQRPASIAPASRPPPFTPDVKLSPSRRPFPSHQVPESVPSVPPSNPPQPIPTVKVESPEPQAPQSLYPIPTVKIDYPEESSPAPEVAAPLEAFDSSEQPKEQEQDEEEGSEEVSRNVALDQNDDTEELQRQTTQPVPLAPPSPTSASVLEPTEAGFTTPSQPHPKSLPAPRTEPEPSPAEPSEPVSPAPQNQGPPLFLSDDSESEEEVVIGADGFPLPSMEELQHQEQDDEDLDGLIEAETRGLTGVLHDTGKTQPAAPYAQTPQVKPASHNEATLEEMATKAADEVARLRAQHVASRRSEEDITTEMALDVQYMLRQFGIPYITGPMEAEAQCAALVELGLCDGIITDDSDVFLFGGKRVLKNMFNDSKTVQVFTLHDLERGVGLDRTRLIELAYLLGSDYTPGLEGVGIVFAMEILSVFPQEDGLHRFRQWWIKVQKGGGPEVDEAVLPPHANPTEKATLRKRLKRIKRTLVNKVHLSLTGDWPNPEVQEAYLKPQVDLSNEPFAWGVPDLEQVRRCLSHFLGWGPDKVDQYVQPVIQQVVSRARNPVQQNLLNKYPGFAGPAFQPARRAASFGSGRLQQVVQGFRAARAVQQDDAANEGAESEQDGPLPLAAPEVAPEPTNATRGRGRGRGQARGKGSARDKGNARGKGSVRGRGGKATEPPTNATNDSDSSLTAPSDPEYQPNETSAPRGRGQTRGRGQARSSTTRAPSATDPGIEEPETTTNARPRPRPRPARRNSAQDHAPTTQTRTSRLRVARDLSLDDLSPLSPQPSGASSRASSQARTPADGSY